MPKIQKDPIILSYFESESVSTTSSLIPSIYIENETSKIPAKEQTMAHISNFPSVSPINKKLSKVAQKGLVFAIIVTTPKGSMGIPNT
jgi:hypothetical protein